MQVAYLVRSPYWRSHVEERPAVLSTDFASSEEREAACAKWAVRFVPCTRLARLC